ncbi:MAG TPA: ABC transporter ATP-binding protein, partial [Nitrososphaerales archaeon]|nr:ABC transporter ATP-binding protein [Nitrososphaerales archaeon]
GGQRQRIAVARALATNAEFLILDEPTSFLDVSVQAQVLNLLKDLQKELKLTYLFISHNLSVIAHMSDRVGVLYLGKMMEMADTETIYTKPRHPYTHALMQAIPVPDPALRRQREVLSGEVPSLTTLPPGCVFHDRCPYATDKCRTEEPELLEISPGHWVSCHYAKELNLTPLADFKKAGLTAS